MFLNKTNILEIISEFLGLDSETFMHNQREHISIIMLANDIYICNAFFNFCMFHIFLSI